MFPLTGRHGYGYGFRFPYPRQHHTPFHGVTGMCGYAGQVCDHLTSSCGDFVDRFSINIKHQQPPPPPSSTTANDDDDGRHNSPDTNEGEDETTREWQREGRGWATRRVAQPLLLCFFVRVLIYFRFLLYEQVFYRLAATNIDEGITTTNGTNTTPSLAPKASGGFVYLF